MGTSDPTESAPLLGDRPNAGADLEAGSSIDPRVERQKRQSRGMLHRAAVLSVAATLVLFGCVAMASVCGARSLAASKLGDEYDSREDVDLDFVEEFDGDAPGRGIGGSEVSDPESAARAWDDAAPESQPVATTAADSEEETDPLAAWNDGANDPTPWKNVPEGGEQGAGAATEGGTSDEAAESDGRSDGSSNIA